MFALKLFFAGLAGQILALSWPVLVIIACVALATLGPMIPVVGPFIPNSVRRGLVVVAIIFAAFLFGEVRGINVADTKWKARAALVKQKVDDVVKTSPLDDDGWVDPYNSPDN